jgi:hypothetical protein
MHLLDGMGGEVGEGARSVTSPFACGRIGWAG